MARVTTEDCLGEGKCEDVFSLVMVAAMRARQLSKGLANPKVDPDDTHFNEKSTVLALREIAAGTMNKEVCEMEQQRIQEMEEHRHYGYSGYSGMRDDAVGSIIPTRPS